MRDHEAVERVLSGDRRPRAVLRGIRPSPEADVAVLVVHGGRSRSAEPVRPWRLAYLRMWWLARRLGRERGGTAVWLLRNRVRGWNEPERDPVTDARWALREIRRRMPRARIVLVGHSMGARACLLLADEPGVRDVCALSPWIEPSDPVEQLAGTEVLIVHGDHDGVTSPHASAEYARRADRAGHAARYRLVPGGGHAMLRRHREWTRLAREFVAEIRDSAGEHQPPRLEPRSGDQS
ncbi:alpha/beta hydrolase [Actinopolyspora erythraea]|uniref:Alpha/beta hydrolase n=1 Tax=Actinopolyspora erythraea TaxID=414996 RepID=A0A223RQA9_9ACTN|nr:alpha/beta fold hydrolase [Actinopolyspora erythraea]ASU78061.1 alpha/beta hydrolase [Actinopolyspora erythraea]